MIPSGIRRVAWSGIAAAVLVGCTNLAVVEDRLENDGVSATEFSVDDAGVTLSARFNTDLTAGQRFMVEWKFPDGSVYLRKSVTRSATADDLIETRMPIRGKAPARHPGVWHVRLWDDGGTLFSRSFEILAMEHTAGSAAGGFAGIASCGPSRWNDTAISARGSGAMTSGRPGAWIGGQVLEAAGATYSGVVLLTGCAPG